MVLAGEGGAGLDTDAGEELGFGTPAEGNLWMKNVSMEEEGKGGRGRTAPSLYLSSETRAYSRNSEA